MSVLPIVDRELRIAARRKGTYWMRFWAACGMLAIWLAILLNFNARSMGRLGPHLLNALGILALVFSTLAGVFLTADSLSEEKREGTIGLLFLTDLKSHDVIFGKLAAHSLHAFFGLLAVIPILGLTLLVGGVTGLEFMRLSLVFVMTLFFSLGISIAVSAATREAKQAISSAFLVVVIFAGVFPAFWWLNRLIKGVSSHDFLLWPSPVFAYMKGFDVGYKFGSGAQEFWSSLAVLFGIGLGGIVFANVVLPRVWQERGRTVGTARRFKLFLAFIGKGGARRLPAFWRDEPMFWLAFRDGSPRVLAWWALFLIGPFWLSALIVSVVSSRWNKEAFITALFTAYGMHFVVKMLLAVEASRRMNEDRRSGAWELLLVTPLPVKSILAGQKKALFRHFAGVLAALSAVNVVMMTAAFVFPKELQMEWRDQALFGEMFLGGILAVFVDFYGLSWVGMWRGLTMRQHHRAVLVTIVEVMGPSLGVFFLMFFLRIDPGGDGGVAIMMGLWFALGIAVSVLRGRRARGKLLKEFRAAVGRRA